MKKLFSIIFISILYVNKLNASCDYEKYLLLSSRAKEIVYEYEYDYKKETFDVIFYNVVDDIYMIYDYKNFYKDKNNNIVIEGISQGTNMQVGVKTSLKDCEKDLSILYINIPYYNNIKDNEICDNYKMLSQCSSSYLSYKNTIKITKNAIENYEKSIKENEEENSIIEDNEVKEQFDFLNFVKKTGIKILLLVLTTLITFSIYNVKFRKAKHGI